MNEIALSDISFIYFWSLFSSQTLQRRFDISLPKHTKYCTQCWRTRMVPKHLSSVTESGRSRKFAEEIGNFRTPWKRKKAPQNVTSVETNKVTYLYSWWENQHSDRKPKTRKLNSITVLLSINRLAHLILSKRSHLAKLLFIHWFLLKVYYWIVVG